MKQQLEKSADGEGKAALTRIVMVDDHPIVRRGVAALLETTDDLRIVAECGSAEEIEKKIVDENPDLLLLDLSMPDYRGLQLLKDVLASHPQLPILVLSRHEEDVFAERALQNGARGYIMKQEPGERLIEAIRGVALGGRYVSPRLMSRMLASAGGKSSMLQMADGPAKLSPAEFDVFQHLGQSMAMKQVAAKLKRSYKTIQTHRNNIMSKLGFKTPEDLYRYAILWSRDAN